MSSSDMTDRNPFYVRSMSDSRELNIEHLSYLSSALLACLSSVRVNYIDFLFRNNRRWNKRNNHTLLRQKMEGRSVALVDSYYPFFEYSMDDGSMVYLKRYFGLKFVKRPGLVDHREIVKIGLIVIVCCNRKPWVRLNRMSLKK
jgi:hypothetical protein